MPDFERVVDDLRVTVADDPVDKAKVEGFVEGKTYARKQIVALCLFVLAIMVLITISIP